jgi:hypothetical protein
MRKILFAGLFAALPSMCCAFGEFRTMSMPGSAQADMDFCRAGKVVVVKGYCGGKNAKSAARISEKGCMDVINQLPDKIKELYPAVEVELYEKMSPDDVAGVLSPRTVFGFVFVGAGDKKGGFLLDAKTALYPDADLCPKTKVDIFAGFYSFSKYSPEKPAPAALRKNVLSRFELEAPGKYLLGSWPKNCSVSFAGLYATPTLSGRLQRDTQQFFQALSAGKERQVKKAFTALCNQCDFLNAQNEPLAKLICHPYSNACQGGHLPKEAQPLVEQNYCRILYGVEAKPK